MLPQLPSINISQNIQRQEYKTKTYKLDIEKRRISGYVDKLDAVKQAVFKILQTERFENIIYSWDYGAELKSLIGKSRDFIENDIQRVISEALEMDRRIISVGDFVFTQDADKLIITFEVISIEGDFTAQIIQ